MRHQWVVLPSPTQLSRLCRVLYFRSSTSSICSPQTLIPKLIRLSQQTKQSVSLQTKPHITSHHRTERPVVRIANHDDGTQRIGSILYPKRNNRLGLASFSYFTFSAASITITVLVNKLTNSLSIIDQCNTACFCMALRVNTLIT